MTVEVRSHPGNHHGGRHLAPRGRGHGRAQGIDEQLPLFSPGAYVLVPPGATAKTLITEFARYLGIPVTTRMT